MSNYEDLLKSSQRRFTGSPTTSKMLNGELGKSKPEPPKRKIKPPVSVGSYTQSLEDEKRRMIDFLNRIGDRDSDIWRKYRQLSKPMAVSDYLNLEVKKLLRGD